MVTKGVVLPAAISGQQITDAPVLSLSNEDVFLDQKFIGKTQTLLSNPKPLVAALGELRELWQKTHPRQEFKGQINLQAHKDLPSTVVSQFMALLPNQAYSTVQLAVLSRGNQ